MFSLHPLTLCGADDKLKLPCPKWLGNYVIFIIIIMIAWVRWPNTCCSEQTDHGCCFSCIATMGRRFNTGMCAGSRQKSDPFHCWQLHWGGKQLIFLLLCQVRGGKRCWKLWMHLSRPSQPFGWWATPLLDRLCGMIKRRFCPGSASPSLKTMVWPWGAAGEKQCQPSKKKALWKVSHSALKE